MKSSRDSFENSHSRRRFIIGGMTLAFAASASKSLAGSDGHHHHHHGTMKNKDLIGSAVDCTTKGKLCRDHCIELVKAGDTSISDCLDIVIDTIAMCETLTQLAVSNSRHLGSFAQVCIEVCKDCKKECRAHKDKHKECKECMAACASCIEQLEKVVA